MNGIPTPDGVRKGIVYHNNLIQGTDEWLQARCGLLTASEMHKIITPTLKVADNDKTRAHLWELLAQRITGYVEPQYVSDDMLRGQEDEVRARDYYREHYAMTKTAGFVTNDEWGFTIGYSPDDLVGEDGLIECKSRRQRFQVQTIVENVPDQIAVPDYHLQCQTGMLVTKRKWCDLVSYSGGLPLAVIRIHADHAIQEVIVAAASAFETKLAEKLAIYNTASAGLVPTERVIEQDMFA